MSENATNMPRRWLIAALFSYFFPGLGYFYVGRLGRGLVHLALMALLGLALLHGLGGVFTNPWIAGALAAFGLLVTLFAIVDSARIALRSGDYQLKGTNRWPAYLATIFIGAGLSAMLNVPQLGFKPGVKSYNAPSGSMEPALRVGDWFLVDQQAYEDAKPQRGDVIVFRHPTKEQVFVKRVIGVGGDIVQMKNGQVQLNGTRLPLTADGQHDLLDFGGRKPVAVFVEQLPSGRTHRILDSGTTQLDNTNAFNVPTGHVFVLGDNRDNSADSRVASQFGLGFVPLTNVRGKVAFVYWARDKSRIGEMVR